ncbi:glycosyltransferase [Clostridium sp. AF19-22AC]|jgi:GT2 family glycosyltransferase|uniref:glycosyltransferase n=1 Tax=Clostridia TaxID=186801 RepID=UPI000E48B3AC|nr:MULTISPECIES: glycosyltransferase [Clostridia]RHR31914.1 glycosyltransferase [Clostridium sp. AF19-22AC]
MDIVFVILHYLAIDETRKCVDYITENIDTESYQIIIVDNASANGSGAVLKDYYSRQAGITVILNAENLGFAKGNNVGFLYAKKRWNPRYIVLLNNDVYLLEKELLHKLDAEFKKSGFAVSGPLIMTADGRCDINPIRTTPMTKDAIIKDIQIYKRRQFLYKYHLMGMRNKILQLLKGTERKRAAKNYIQGCKNVQLHGCFLVFSEKYTERFDGLDDRTFLFREEAILYKHMLENNMVTVYQPEITVFHEEDAATDQFRKTEKQKALFELDNHIKSLNILLDVYSEYEKH